MPQDLTPDRNDGEPQGACRALVVVEPRASLSLERPLAHFVTQLIAGDRRLGPYRTARRAEPGEAVSVYAGPGPAATPHGFQRVV